MPAETYVDTSALAKFYVLEPDSPSFRDYLLGLQTPVISDLTLTEMRCLLARRRRTGLLSENMNEILYAAFLNHISQRHYAVLPVERHHFAEAGNTITLLPHIALRTLDALHLAIVTYNGLTSLATADRTMADAAAELGVGVDFFG